MTTSPGHNSAALLKDYIDRINDRLDAKQEVVDEVTLLYAPAKESGINVKGLREHIKLMREDEEKRRKREEALESIRNELRGLAETPLGKAAIAEVMRAG